MMETSGDCQYGHATTEPHHDMIPFAAAVSEEGRPGESSAASESNTRY